MDGTLFLGVSGEREGDCRFVLLGVVTVHSVGVFLAEEVDSLVSELLLLQCFASSSVGGVIGCGEGICSLSCIVHYRGEWSLIRLKMARTYVGSTP